MNEPQSDTERTAAGELEVAGGSAGVSRRQVLGSGAALALGVLLAACGSDDESNATSAGGGENSDPIKVAFILPSFAQVRWKSDQREFEAEANKLGLDVIVQVSNDDEVLQASQVENVLTQGIDVLVLTPVNVDTAQTLVQKAAAADVPVISYNYLVADADVAAVVQRDGVEVGRLLAQAAVDASPEGNYVLALGDQGTSIAREKAEGNFEVLQPLIDSGAITVVSEQYNRAWSPDLAQKQVENALTANENDVTAILTSNDGMAFGAIEALRGQNMGGDVFVTGEDAETAALKLIKQGLMNASIFTRFELMARTAAQLAAKLGRGETIEAPETISNGTYDVPWFRAELITVTGENLDEFAEEYSWWVDADELA